jgi:hypothetical protein
MALTGLTIRHFQIGYERRAIALDLPRVFLKSPVRYFRTPGFVRGLLGNWQFHRNGASSRFTFGCNS